MAHLVLQIAYDKVDGIAVDTHVHRIVNRLGNECFLTSNSLASKIFVSLLFLLVSLMIAEFQDGWRRTLRKKPAQNFRNCCPGGVFAKSTAYLVRESACFQNCGSNRSITFECSPSLFSVPHERVWQHIQVVLDINQSAFGWIWTTDVPSSETKVWHLLVSGNMPVIHCKSIKEVERKKVTDLFIRAAEVCKIATSNVISRNTSWNGYGSKSSRPS